MVRTILYGSWFGLFFIFQSPDLISQGQNDHCSSATELMVYYEDFNCIEGTTAGADGQIIPTSQCNLAPFPTVWYHVSAVPSTNGINIHVRGDLESIPLVRLFAFSDCDFLVPVMINDVQSYCLTGYQGHVEILSGQWPVLYEFYIAVSMLDPSHPDFELCINALYDSPACQRETNFDYFRNSDKSINDPYTYGERVSICYDVVQWNPSTNGCVWMQGVVPIFGDGWNDSSFDVSGQPLNATINGNQFGEWANGLYSTSTWDWFDDVYYHRFNPVLQSTYLNVDGKLDLCSMHLDPMCPDFGGMNQECCAPCWDQAHWNLLPPGWFCYGGTDAGCSLTGPPIAHDWGDGNTCGNVMGPWSFCFDLEVGSYVMCEDEEYSDGARLAMFTFSDWDVGGWDPDGFPCYADPGIAYHFPIICSAGVGEKIIVDLDICHGDTLAFRPSDYVTGLDILYWMYTEDINNPSYGYILAFDSLIEENNFSIDKVYSPQPLNFYGYVGASRVGKYLEVHLHFYPEIDASFEYTISNNEVSFESELNIANDHLWFFGDGDSSEVENPFHIYEHPGTYLVEHRLITDCGADTVVRAITILPGLPIAGLDITGSKFCLGDTLRVKAENTWNIDHFAWWFGDSLVTTVDSPELILPLTTTGLFDVGIIVSNAAGADTLIYEDTIEVLGLPEAHFTFEIYDLQTVFHYNGSPADYMLWVIIGDTILSGKDLIIDWSLPGDYPMMLLATNDCGTDTLAFVLHIELTNTIDQLFTSSFVIYPNPATTYFSINSSNLNLEGSFISLYDLDGKLLRQEPITTRNPKIEIEMFPSGLYTVELCSKTGCYTAKLMIQR